MDFKVAKATKSRAQSLKATWKFWSKWVESGAAIAFSDLDYSHSVPALLEVLMRHARIFRLPLEARVDDLKIESLALIFADTYIQPFPIIAVESKDAITLLFKNGSIDPQGKVVTPEIGIPGKWVAFTLRPSENIENTALSMVLVTSLHIKDNMTFAPSFTILMAQFKNGSVEVKDPRKMDDDAKTFMAEESLHSAWLAMAVMLAVQQPKNFIVEEAAVAPVRGKRAKKRNIKPLSARPIYVSLTPSEIRKVYGMKKPGMARSGHERRAHFRRLTSERFTFARGTTVPVKASWVGPTSGTTNEGREYRIRVDISSPAVLL